MPFKTSFFNPTLFKKNMSRSWPLWGGVTAVGALLPLYLILAVMSGEEIYLERADFMELLYNAVAYFLPAFTICYALLVAMFVWNYLHHPRSVGMMHSLAVSRDNLFVTSTLSGLAMLLIPYVLVGGFLCVFAACYGAFDAGAVALTILSVLLENILFFGMGTICAMITGNIFAVAAYYGIMNFIAPALDLLINSLAQEFIFGLSGEVSVFSRYLAPMVGLYNSVECTRMRHWNEAELVRTEVALEGFGVIAIYGAVGIALLVGAWALYRARRSESAGDIVAFRSLRPVFRFGVAVISSLTLGRLLYELFWGTIFQEGEYANLAAMGVCMAITAVVGYYIASMLLEKTLRVFKGSLKGVVVVCAVTAVLCAAVSLDLFGVERYVPDADEVETVELDGNFDIVCNSDEMPLLLDEILALHRAIVEDADYVKGFSRYDYHSQISWSYISLTYNLKNGDRVERVYQLPVTYERSQSGETYDGRMLAILKNPEALAASVAVPAGAEVSGAYLEYYDREADNWWGSSLDQAAGERVYAALLADAREGNFGLESNIYWDWDKEDVSDDAAFARFDYAPTLNIEFRVKEQGSEIRYSGVYRTLQPGMKHTLKALLDCGVIHDEIVKGWTD